MESRDPESGKVHKMTKVIKMTTAPVEKLILSLAFPSIAMMLISALYNMADTYFVSSLGTSQVAAVGIAFPLMAIVQAIAFLFGQGSGAYVARALGSGNNEGASRMIATGFVSGFIFMAILAIAGLIGIKPLVRALGATETIMPHAVEYVLFILLASPWMVSAMIMNQMLRFQGSAMIAMVGMLTGAVLNIFLDPLFIFVLGMGVKGAAVATMLSQIVSFLILFLYGFTRKDITPIKFRHFSPSVSRYRDMVKGGLPPLLRQGLMSFATIITNHFAGAYGDAAIAAISIVNRICMFAFSAVLGFCQGFQPVCGFNYGAKLYSRVRKGFWFCIRVSVIALVALAIIFAVFAPNIISFFRKDDLEVIAIGALGLRLRCISFPSLGIIVMCTMITQSMGMALEGSITAASRNGLFLVPSLFILSPLLGLMGIQLSVPAADNTCLFIIVPILIKCLKKLSVPDGGGAGTVSSAVLPVSDSIE